MGALGKVGAAPIDLDVEKKDLFFKLLDKSVFECDPVDISKNSIDLELQGKTGKYKDWLVQALGKVSRMIKLRPMRLISREDALRLYRTHPVVVEFNNYGIRVTQAFDSGSPFFLSTGPYDYGSARYFLANESGCSLFETGPVAARWKSKPVDSTPETDAERDLESWEAEPVGKETSESVSVKIMAEDGKSAPAKGILIGLALKF